MTIFEMVKRSVTTRQAAEYYGFTANRAGKIACPFHDDRTPSMKVDKRFHCFGCGADGDVIDFVARLYGLDAKAAAEKLAVDFQIVDDRTESEEHPIKSKAQNTRDIEARYFRVLLDYLRQLQDWERVYAPKPEDEKWPPQFVEALQKKDYIEYLLDVLLCGTAAERTALIKDIGEEVMKFERRLSELDSEAPALPDSGGSQSALGAEREGTGEEHYAECVHRLCV